MIQATSRSVTCNWGSADQKHCARKRWKADAAMATRSGAAVTGTGGGWSDIAVPAIGAKAEDFSLGAQRAGRNRSGLPRSPALGASLRYCVASLNRRTQVRLNRSAPCALSSDSERPSTGIPNRGPRKFSVGNLGLRGSPKFPIEISAIPDFGCQCSVAR